MAATEVRKVGLAELRGIVDRGDRLAGGTQLFDDKKLLNLARHGNKLFCEVKGSELAPYKVTLVFGDDAADVKSTCTCGDARSRRVRFCKHGAGLLVAWARAPEAFAVSDSAPGEAKKQKVKQGTASNADLRKQGVEQVTTLVRDLAVAGVSAMHEDRVQQVQALGANLRRYKLIRISAKTLDLVGLLESARVSGALPAVAYTDLMGDLLLTARKLEKHLAGGEPLEDRHVEELVGKTWRKDDLKPISGLDLIEYAYLVRITSDDYIIRESRLFDVAAGAHYSEKQIVPSFLRNDPKPSRGGALNAGARGATYPGYAPTRLVVSDLGDKRPIDHAALGRLVEKALPDVGSAILALQEHRRDVFAPDLLPVAIRVDTLFARGSRMQCVDATGHALHLPDDRSLEERLGSALGGARLAALIGDLGVEAALPTLFPLAVVIEGPLGLEMRGLDAPKGAGKPAAGVATGSAAWAEVARAAGASAAAITLAEVREELAEAFVVGLAALGPRVTEALEARLRDLGLEKQAVLLHALAERGDPEAKLDDFVKLYQVLGIALVRLAGATEVDRSSMERVPTYESVFVPRPTRWMDPTEVTAERAAGRLNRYEAAVQYAQHYENLPPEMLAASIYPTWADGSAAPYVVRAFAGRREEGLAAARRALGSQRGRVAKITALRVLAAVGGLEAQRILHEIKENKEDIGMRGLAADAIDAIERRTLGDYAVERRRGADVARVNELAQELASAAQQDARLEAIDRLVKLGHLSAIPALRQAFLGDRAQKVRNDAAMALALLGDTEMVDTMVSMLARRNEDEEEAKLAAKALGMLGDVRGLRELLAAYAEGYRPIVIAEALRSLGPVALDPLLDLIEAQPHLAERKAALSVLKELPDRDLAAVLADRVRAQATAPSFAEKAALYLKLAVGSGHPDIRRAVGDAVLAAIADPGAHKVLVKAAKKAIS